MHTTENSTDQYGRQVTTHVTTNGIKVVVTPDDSLNQVEVIEHTLTLLSLDHNNPEGAGRTIVALIEQAYYQGRQAGAQEVKDLWDNEGLTISQAVAQIVGA